MRNLRYPALCQVFFAHMHISKLPNQVSYAVRCRMGLDAEARSLTTSVQGCWR